MRGATSSIGAHTPFTSTLRKYPPTPSISPLPSSSLAPWTTLSSSIEPSARFSSIPNVLSHRHQRDVRSHPLIQCPRPNTGRKTGTCPPNLFFSTRLEIAILSPVVSSLPSPSHLISYHPHSPFPHSLPLPLHPSPHIIIPRPCRLIGGLQRRSAGRWPRSRWTNAARRPALRTAPPCARRWLQPGRRRHRTQAGPARERRGGDLPQDAVVPHAVGHHGDCHRGRAHHRRRRRGWRRRLAAPLAQ